MMPTRFPAAIVNFLLVTSAIQTVARRHDARCLHHDCLCRQTRGDAIHVSCPWVNNTLPIFRDTGVFYDSVSIVNSQLTTIQNSVFRYVRAYGVDLSGNFFREGLPPSSFRGMENSLTEFTCRYSHLPRVPANSISRLHRLTTLRLDGNNITALVSNAFRRNRNLRELHLFDNQITTIQRRAFRGLHNLADLKMAANRLQFIDRYTFTGLSNLSSLDISRNRITEFQRGSLAKLTHLRWLSIDSNRLTSLPAHLFAGLTNLQYLNLEGNPLTQIAENVFNEIVGLKFLSLDIGRINPLRPAMFRGLARMRTLGVGDVGRSTLPEGLFASMRRMRFLSLMDAQSQFDGLTPKVFSPRMHFRQLTVWLDPARDCDCRTDWIRVLTAKGAYFHGRCTHAQEFSCRRRNASI